MSATRTAARTIMIELPDDLVAALDSLDGIADRAWKALLLDLLRGAQISQGKAARLLGVTRYDILDLMASHYIPSGPFTPELGLIWRNPSSSGCAPLQRGVSGGFSRHTGHSRRDDVDQRPPGDQHRQRRDVGHAAPRPRTSAQWRGAAAIRAALHGTAKRRQVRTEVPPRRRLLAIRLGDCSPPRLVYGHHTRFVPGCQYPFCSIRSGTWASPAPPLFDATVKP